MHFAMFFASVGDAITVFLIPLTLLGDFFSLMCLQPLNCFILFIFPVPVTFTLLATDLLVLILGIVFTPFQIEYPD